MKYLYVKNLKIFNRLRLNKFLIDSNSSFFIFYVNYDDLYLYKDFLNKSKFVFSYFFNFGFEKIKILDNWKLWGNDYYVCFFFNNDFYYQIDFILNNKNIIDDYIFNGVFLNVDNLFNDTIFHYDDLIDSLNFNLIIVIFNIYTCIYMFLQIIIEFFVNIKKKL